MYLSRGTERKLTQRTLLQMNFCLPEKVQIRSSKREQSRSNLLLITGDGRTVGNAVHGLPDFDCSEESDSTSNMSESVLNLKSALHKDGLSKSSICDDKTDENIVTHFLFENIEVPDDGMAIMLDDISVVILDTFIVGRKFSDAKEINFGERISLVRDPHNIKDPNAVKKAVSDENKENDNLERFLDTYEEMLRKAFWVDLSRFVCISSLCSKSNELASDECIVRDLLCGQKQVKHLSNGDASTITKYDFEENRFLS
ncbi:hypothetical protein L484_019139 [Morus notabilis]|uniref:Uncharacterized protein n=1 Tax=Morus notabilis TaxID=981085 RepID=W9R4V0_9ROSA|nr:hypothetical protein L484_019139 [Morus notabilis]